MLSVISAVFGSKALKVVGGLGISSGILTVFMGMIDKVESNTRIYVDIKHETVRAEITNLKVNQDSMMRLLMDINNHLLNKREK